MTKSDIKTKGGIEKAAEVSYRRIFADDSERVAFLFELYQKLAGDLFVEGTPKKAWR